MLNNLLGEIQKLQHTPSVDPEVLKIFFSRLSNNTNYVRTDNPADHFGVMFVPYDRKTKSIFLVHHKKADDWIPPGGHLDEGEEPIAAVKRECFEELQYVLQEEKPAIFNISRKEIRDPLRICRFHYDLWYLVPMEKKDFVPDMREFNEAKWVTLDEAVTIIKEKDYNKIVAKLAQE